MAAAREVGLAQALHELDAVPAERGELGQELGAVARAVPARRRDLGLVPRLQPGVVLREDDADASGEPSLLGLDEMPEHVVDAPLSRGRMPREQPRRRGGELRNQRRGGGAEELSGFLRREPGRHVSHRCLLDENGHTRFRSLKGSARRPSAAHLTLPRHSSE
jgi:hypothetical protein